VAAMSSVNSAEARLTAANAALQRAEAEKSVPEPSTAAPEPPTAAAPEPLHARPAPARAAASDAAPSGGSDAGPGLVGPKLQAALDTEWARLARAVGDARKRHERLAENAFRVQVASRSLKAGYSLGVVVLDEASPPDKPIRSRGLVAGLAALGALLLALGLTLARAVLDDRIFDEADLSPLGHDPILSVIPAMRTHAIILHGGRRRGESPERA